MTIAWQQSAGLAAGRLQVVERRADGHYGPVQDLAPGSAGALAVAVNARDQAVVAWVEGTFLHAAVKAATRRSGQAFTAAITVVGGNQGGALPLVGLDDGGTALLTWLGPFDDAASGLPFRNVNASYLRVGDVRAGPVTPLLTPGLGQLDDVGNPALAVNGHGAGIVSWQVFRRGGSGPVSVEIARATAAHTLTPPQSMGTTDPSGGAVIAVGPAGQGIVAWEGLSQPIRAVTAAGPTSPFGSSARVSLPRRFVSAPAVAIDGHERAAALWWDLGPTNPKRRPSGSTLRYATS